MSKRPGFTVLELIIVMAIIGIMALVAFPKLQRATSTMSIRSSKQEIAVYLAQTRAAAIHNGRTATFVRSGNIISAAIDTGGTTLMTFASPQDLGQSEGVALTNPSATSYDSIRFDPRGLTPSSGTVTIYVTKDSKTDSVCVVGRGKITTRGCAL